MTVLAGARVFDPDSGETTRADVRLDGDRIAEAGPGLDGGERVDCSGGLLIPGLIDCHVHVAFPRPEPLPRSARILEAVPVLRRLLARGITTVRDAWGADAGFKHALRERWITGPDLLVSLRQLGPTGGLGDSWKPPAGAVDHYGDPSLPDPLFDGPDAARAAVTAASNRSSVVKSTWGRGARSEPAATRTPASIARWSERRRLLRLDDDRGRLEPGPRADVVLLDGPDLDVTDLPGRIRAVWHDGERVSEAS